MTFKVQGTIFSRIRELEEVDFELLTAVQHNLNLSGVPDRSIPTGLMELKGCVVYSLPTEAESEVQIFKDGRISSTGIGIFRGNLLEIKNVKNSEVYVSVRRLEVR